MYLFNRNRQANPGQQAEAIAAAKNARDYVNAHSALNVLVGTPLFGRPGGTITFGIAVESRAQIVGEVERMFADPAYQALAAAIDATCGPPEDSIKQFLHLNGMAFDDASPVFAFTQGWSADIARMQVDKAITWAIGISDHVTKLTGVGISVLGEAYGNFGTLVWVATLSSLEQADAMNEAMFADDEWRNMLLQGADLFIDGRTKAWLNRIL